MDWTTTFAKSYFGENGESGNLALSELPVIHLNVFHLTDLSRQGGNLICAADLHDAVTASRFTDYDKAMTTLIARIALPTTKANIFSLCSRTAKLGGVIGTTGLFGAHLLSNPIFVRTQCQGGVAPRYQHTQADLSLKRSRAPVDFQQLSSGSVLGMITGYLTAKIGRLFLFSFGGIFLLAAFLRYQGYLPSPWPLLRRTLHLDTESVEGGELTAFLQKNTTFKASFVATFMIGLLYS